MSESLRKRSASALAAWRKLNRAQAECNCPIDSSASLAHMPQCNKRVAFLAARAAVTQDPQSSAACSECGDVRRLCTARGYHREDKP